MIKLVIATADTLPRCIFSAKPSTTPVRCVRAVHIGLPDEPVAISCLGETARGLNQPVRRYGPLRDEWLPELAISRVWVGCMLSPMGSLALRRRDA